MNVALPEVDGRILSRAVSFKSERSFDAATECGIVAHMPRADRIDFVAQVAKNWARLARPAASEPISEIPPSVPGGTRVPGLVINTGAGANTPISLASVSAAAAASAVAAAPAFSTSKIDPKI